MAFFEIPGIRISAISCAVPRNTVHNSECTGLPQRELDLFIRTTGIRQRRVASDKIATSDLCLASARALLDGEKAHPDDIGIIIFVTQSADYYLPATSVILQSRLGLRTSIPAFDINLGCSGYPYGLSVIAGLMNSMNIEKGLLFCGDISSFTASPLDRTTHPVFGDAGSATLLERDSNADTMQFCLMSDGSRHKAIIIPDGGIRNRLTPDSLVMKTVHDGIQRSRIHLELNGIDVFNFGTDQVSATISEFFQHFSSNPDQYDYFIMHQANLLLNETIRKKAGFEISKTPYSLDEFGNTSSASIPLTMTTRLGKEIASTSNRLLLAGFGVGLSWGIASVPTDRPFCPPLIEVDEDDIELQ